MSIVLNKPVNYQGAEFQTSIFLPADNYKLFKLVPTNAIVEPYKSSNESSSWNGKHVTKFDLVDAANGRSLAVKTVPIEIIEGAVKQAAIEGVSLWTKTGSGKDKREVFNDKLKYVCKAGILTCWGIV